jgi:hypothetical protein
MFVKKEKGVQGGKQWKSSSYWDYLRRKILLERGEIEKQTNNAANNGGKNNVQESFSVYRGEILIPSRYN